MSRADAEAISVFTVPISEPSEFRDPFEDVRASILTHGVPPGRPSLRVLLDGSIAIQGGNMS
jgi:hypothetical protein